MPVLVDTNIIIDLLTDDPTWADWSLEQLERCESGGLVINPVIYAELCFGFPTTEAVDELVRQYDLAWREVHRFGLFKAAKAFQAYKKRGGSRTFILPDFFVGGHAEAAELAVLTRDVKRFRTYFPDVRLLAPIDAPLR